jgi:hypothetical protein
MIIIIVIIAIIIKIIIITTNIINNNNNNKVNTIDYLRLDVQIIITQLILLKHTITVIPYGF